LATTLKKTNVVVVGLGAAGGTAVLPLTQAGLEVIGLEAGDWLHPRDFAPDELRNNLRGWPQSVQKANQEVPTHRRNEKSPYSPRPAVHPMMNAVGGTTLHYFAQAWRLNPWDFKVVSETTRRYGASRLPKGCTVEDWPFAYEELEPYYDKVDYEIGVSGKAGNIKGKVDPRGNVFEGPRQREYPMPPLRQTEFTENMLGAAKRLGWHPFPGAALINSQAYGGRAGCVFHGFCTRGGCHVLAKNGPHITTIPRALETKRLQVVTRAHVTRIEVDEKNTRVSGVTYIKDGNEYFQPADVVLLGSYTYENVRLLLMSKSKAFPNGLANNNKQVGRHYMTHNTSSRVYGLFPKNINNWYGTQGQGVALDDWADDNFDHGTLDFIGGGSLFVYSDRRPIDAARMPLFGKAPSWGPKWKAFIKENADRWNLATMQKTTLPYEDNYLDLDPTVKDRLGNPVIRITADWKDNDLKMSAFLREKMRLWFREAGAIATEDAPTGTQGPSTHAIGGTRMGVNKETSTTDRWGFTHEVPNLGLMGGSVMGVSGARNPTLTIMALSWRTGEHLAKQWQSIAR
jgi:gluconate 2-dehydrogenase alpha chain